MDRVCARAAVAMLNHPDVNPRMEPFDQRRCPLSAKFYDFFWPTYFDGPIILAFEWFF